ncbi:EamA family transporter [Spirillospora sp. NPDC048824]|uniref:EamA family transporter n=1 Tax=unclassified Spirillospora TaxID=2642701 RepID=UPI00372232F5
MHSCAPNPDFLSPIYRALLGVITTGGGYLLFARGLRTTPATTATTLTLAEPAVAAVLGTVLLDEDLGAAAPGGLALVGASLIVLIAPAGPRASRRSREKTRTGR